MKRLKSVQWAPSGIMLDGDPHEITQLLSEIDGKERGFGHGDGPATVFHHPNGYISVLPQDWVTVTDAGHIYVSGVKPEDDTERITT